MPLVVCATPIGNLEDVTLRVLAALREADAVLCEDTRRTRVLLDRYGIRARRLVSFHRHNEARADAELLPRLVAGETLALVSDAGLPGRKRPGRPPRRGGARRGHPRDGAARARARWRPRSSRAASAPRSTGSSAISRGARPSSGAVGGCAVVDRTRPSRSSRRDGWRVARGARPRRARTGGSRSAVS